MFLYIHNYQQYVTILCFGSMFGVVFVRTLHFLSYDHVYHYFVLFENLHQLWLLLWHFPNIKCYSCADIYCVHWMGAWSVPCIGMVPYTGSRCDRVIRVFSRIRTYATAIVLSSFHMVHSYMEQNVLPKKRCKIYSYYCYCRHNMWKHVFSCFPTRKNVAWTCASTVRALLMHRNACDSCCTSVVPCKHMVQWYYVPDITYLVAVRSLHVLGTVVARIRYGARVTVVITWPKKFSFWRNFGWPLKILGRWIFLNSGSTAV